MEFENIEAFEYHHALLFATEFMKHFVNNEELYKKKLKKKVYEGIMMKIPEVTLFIGKETLNLIQAVNDGKNQRQDKVDFQLLGLVYCFARIYIKGISLGDIDGEIDKKALMVIPDIVKRGEKFDKLIKED